MPSYPCLIPYNENVLLNPNTTKKPDKNVGANINWSNNIPVNALLYLLVVSPTHLVTIWGRYLEYQKWRQGPR